MSTKSTKISAYCGNCNGDDMCNDVPYLAWDCDFPDLEFYSCPLRFFEWLKSVGVVRIIHNWNEFYEDYSFFIGGGGEVSSILPCGITDAMIADYFDCPVVFMRRGECYCDV